MANDFSAFVPTWWANGTLAMLWEKLVMYPLVNHDFTNDFAKGGMIVNAKRPRKMVANRRVKGDVTLPNDVAADTIPIPLNQQIIQSFAVDDLDQQYSMQDLIDSYLGVAGQSIATMVDRIILAQSAQFLLAGNVAGNDMQKTYENIVDARSVMDNNLAWDEDRHLIINPSVEAKLLKDATLITEYSTGSDKALRNGIVGNLVGVDLYKTQNSPGTTLASTGSQGIVTLTVTTAANPGDTVIAANQSTPAVAVGDWVKINGQPFKVTAITGSANPYQFTLNRKLPFAVAAGAVVYVAKGVTPGANYAAGYAKTITLNAGANQYIPGVTNFVDIKGDVYGVVNIDPANGGLVLDRPLVQAVGTGDLIKAIPPGRYSLMFHPDALTIACRPMSTSANGKGVSSALASFGGISVRAQLGYSLQQQVEQVTLDVLLGVQILDTNLGCLVCC